MPNHPDRRNIYLAIMKANALGVGLRLSADEVADLAFDDAIETHAMNCLDTNDWPQHKDASAPPFDWTKINLKKKRVGANLTNIAPEDLPRS